MSSTELPRTATSMAAAVNAGECRARDLVDAALTRAAALRDLNPFVLLDPEGARAAAEAADAATNPTPLRGVPIAIKDMTPTRGHLTTRGSWTTGDWVADFDPVIVQRLKAAGAVIIGKTTTPEFAYSGFTHSPRWGITRNPHDPERTPGGSSGGSGCVVGAGCVPLAEGTDMGGSVRIPAAFSGCVGLKPSIGRIPMDILPTVFDNLSHFGPLAATIDDAALFLAVTQGSHDADIQSQPNPDPITTPVAQDVRGMRFALSIDLGYYHVDPEVARQVEAAADALAARGAIVEHVDLAWTRALNDGWFELWGVMLAAAFGEVLPQWREKMDPGLLKLMDRGLAMDAVAYKRLEGLRTGMWHDLANLFTRYDALLCPTCAVPAPKIDAPEDEFDRDHSDGRYAGMDVTSIFNLVPQCPALSVPVGTTDAGLPVGLQIIARRFADATALRIGKAVEADFPPLWDRF